MRNPIRPRIWVPILLCCSVVCLTVPLPLAYGADRADKREIIKQARAAYYSLRGRGLDEFESSVQPNWRLVLKDQLAADPANAEKALTMLNGIHFLVSLGRDGAVKITHREDVAPVNEQAAEGFKQIFSGMEQAMSGFFDSWSPFMLTSPFPEVAGDYTLEELNNQLMLTFPFSDVASEYSLGEPENQFMFAFPFPEVASGHILEELENRYHLSYKEGTAAIATTMFKQDLVINEIKVDSPEFKSVLKPQFTKSAQGLLLSGYKATYQGSGGGASVILNVRIENQPVNGMQLPQRLNLDGSYQGTLFQMELAFSSYKVKVH